MQYILTQNHHNHGLKGRLITREQYIAIPYFDRALYELAEDPEDYDFEVTVTSEAKQEVKYFIRHAMALKEFLDELTLEASVFDVFAALKKKKESEITLPHVHYIIKSNQP